VRAGGGGRGDFTTLGRPAEADLGMLSKLKMPIKALSSTL